MSLYLLREGLKWIVPFRYLYMQDPNQTFRAKLDGKSVLRILLSKKPLMQSAQGQTDQSSNRNKNEGLPPRRRPIDELIPRRQGGFINFWDLGQIADGEDWLDIGYTKVPTVHLHGSTYGIDQFTSFSELTDLVFTVDINDWDTQYRKLSYEEAELYALDVRDPGTGTYYGVGRNGSRYMLDGFELHDSLWTTSGWAKPDSVDEFSFESWGAFDRFGSDTSLYKITTGPTYASSEVSFTLGQKADVYLMPAMSYWEAGTSQSGTPFKNEVLLGKWQLLWRSLFLYHTYDNGRDTPLFSFDPDMFNNHTYYTSDQDAIRDVMLIDAVSAYQDLTSGGFIYQSVGAFPQPAPDVYGAKVSSDNLVIEGGGSLLLHQEGDFLGAIKQNGTFYYFWSKTSDFQQHTRLFEGSDFIF
jgi:hypothetical protein